MRRSAQPVNPAAPAHRPSLDSQKGRVEPPIQPLDKHPELAIACTAKLVVVNQPYPESEEGT
jgi:hypothetical protein